MNKQYVKGLQKWKKINLLMVSKITIVIYLYYFMAGAEDIVSIVQRIKAKEVENGFSIFAPNKAHNVT